MAGFKPAKSELGDWLDKQTLCTIATIGSEGYPNTASVAFSQSDDFDFCIITNAKSRKAINIATNEKVALTITNADDKYTLQLEGDAHQLSWDEFDKYSKHHYEKLPFSLPFKDIPDQVPFVIVPVRMRFSDVSIQPWEVTDIDVTER